MPCALLECGEDGAQSSSLFCDLSVFLEGCEPNGLSGAAARSRPLLEFLAGLAKSRRVTSRELYEEGIEDATFSQLYGAEGGEAALDSFPLRTPFVEMCYADSATETAFLQALRAVVSRKYYTSAPVLWAMTLEQPHEALPLPLPQEVPLPLPQEVPLPLPQEVPLPLPRSNSQIIRDAVSKMSIEEVRDKLEKAQSGGARINLVELKALRVRAESAAVPQEAPQEAPHEAPRQEPLAPQEAPQLATSVGELFLAAECPHHSLMPQSHSVSSSEFVLGAEVPSGEVSGAKSCASVESMQSPGAYLEQRIRERLQASGALCAASGERAPRTWVQALAECSVPRAGIWPAPTPLAAPALGSGSRTLAAKRSRAHFEAPRFSPAPLAVSAPLPRLPAFPVPRARCLPPTVQRSGDLSELFEACLDMEVEPFVGDM